MKFVYRKAAISDIDMLIKLRLDYLTEDRGALSESEKQAVITQLSAYYPKHIESDFIAYIAEAEHNVIAGAFLVVSERPANPAFISGKIGTILNVFTYPEHRRKRIAAVLLRRLIEEARVQNLSYIELSATKSGKPLYEKLGFIVKRSKYTEMKLQLI